MLLVFVDETSDSKFKDYLGLSVATISYTKYPKVKREFQNILRKSAWNEDIEFKGSHLFSTTSGDTSVGIDARIEIAEKLIDLNIAKSNARISFHYLRHQIDPKRQSEEYLRLLPALLNKALPKPGGAAGKNLISVSCDRRNDLTTAQVRTAIQPMLDAKKYVLYEEPTMVTSNFHTVGVLYADIIGYLAARIDTISSDMDLFEGLTPEQLETNGKALKLRSSVKLIEKVKNLGMYQIKAG